MKRVKQKDTAAELALRSDLHGLGLRFRLHRRIEGVVADVVFPTSKVAVFGMLMCYTLWRSLPLWRGHDA